MRIIISLIIFAILIAWGAYVVVRSEQTFFRSAKSKMVFRTVITLLILSVILGTIPDNHLPIAVAKPIRFASFSLLIFMLYYFPFVVITDIVRGINKRHPFLQNPQKFRLGVVIVGIIAVTTIMIIGNYRFNHPTKVYLDIESAKSKQGKELKIVALSDLHLGISLGEKATKKYVNMINAEKPDLVLFVGDLIDHSVPVVVQQNLDRQLQQISAPLGVYGVLGNHEYFAGAGDDLFDFYRKSGIVVLRDTSVLINDEVYLVGRDDAFNKHRKALQKLLQPIDNSKPSILLDHQPNHLQDAEENNIDLQLSGHTHDGQVYPGNLIAAAMFEMSHGYKIKGNTHYYVSSGLEFGDRSMHRHTIGADGNSVSLLTFKVYKF
jgi:predicted MPP superfamily phosphohydrolase